MSDESNVAKNFNAILEDIKSNHQKTTKAISAKSRGKTISLYLLLARLVNEETTMFARLWI